MYETESDIGKRIEAIRKGQKFSRAQFGKLIGISSQYVGMIERGAQGLSVNVIMSICKKTGASADYILFGKSDSTAMISSFSGLSSEQVHIAFDMLSRVAAFVNTTDGNERMIQEVARQQEYFSDPGYEAVS